MTDLEVYGRKIGWVHPEVLNVSSNKSGSDVQATPPGKVANLICSNLDVSVEVPIEQSLHRPVLDIDFAARLIPSSTPGHYHLYLDGILIPHDKYMYLLSALATCGVISEGYFGHSLERGYTAVRAPGDYKPKSEVYDYQPKHMKFEPAIPQPLPDLWDLGDVALDPWDDDNPPF